MNFVGLGTLFHVVLIAACAYGHGHNKANGHLEADISINLAAHGEGSHSGQHGMHGGGGHHGGSEHYGGYKHHDEHLTAGGGAQIEGDMHFSKQKHHGTDAHHGGGGHHGGSEHYGGYKHHDEYLTAGGGVQIGGDMHFGKQKHYGGHAHHRGGEHFNDKSNDYYVQSNNQHHQSRPTVYHPKNYVGSDMDQPQVKKGMATASALGGNAVASAANGVASAEAQGFGSIAEAQVLPHETHMHSGYKAYSNKPHQFSGHHGGYHVEDYPGHHNNPKVSHGSSGNSNNQNVVQNVNVNLPRRQRTLSSLTDQAKNIIGRPMRRFRSHRGDISINQSQSVANAG